MLASDAVAYVTLPKLHALDRLSHDTPDYVCSDMQLTIGMALSGLPKLLAEMPADTRPPRSVSAALHM